MLLNWIVFFVLLIGLFILDFAVLNKKEHEIKIKEAGFLSLFWIAIALSFGGFIFWRLGSEPALQYYAGWVLEKSMSVDNLMIIYVILIYFAVPHHLWHRVLFYGILGALVMRGIILFAGISALHYFEWLFYFFGVLLIWTAWKLLKSSNGGETDPGKNKVLKFVKETLKIPATEDFHGKKFFIKDIGTYMMTPLFAALVVVETTDLIFAVDSLPAIMAVTASQYIAYTSNAFALLGLRALFFLLAGTLAQLKYLSHGLAIILAFIGVKMIIHDLYHIPITWSLLVILVVLSSAFIASILANKLEKQKVQQKQQSSGEEER